MEIKEDRLSLFVDLYQKEFGIKLSASEAHEKATLLMQYVLLFLPPFPKLENDDIMEIPD
jgi:hypothetical protein